MLSYPGKDLIWLCGSKYSHYLFSSKSVHFTNFSPLLSWVTYCTKIEIPVGTFEIKFFTKYIHYKNVLS